MKAKIYLSILLLGISLSLRAQDAAMEEVLEDSSKWELHAYGVVQYNNFQWQTDSTRRDRVDLTQVMFAPEYHFTPKLTLEAEIEFEHGGTGSAMEFDRFEEFGEFEQEIEHGGEVVMEELVVNYTFNRHFALEAGKVKVPVGLLNYNSSPVHYASTWYNNVESTVLPQEWYEIGIAAEGYIDNAEKWEYHAALVNALDNSAFSSANWIQRGSHQRFEYSNAESFAGALRIDRCWGENNCIGFSTYAGNSTPNRPKPDLDADAYVTISDLHLHLQNEKWYAQALCMYGTLQNAALVNDANANISNNLNVKRTPAGSAMLAYFAELGYTVYRDHQNNAILLFGGYYFYDTMYKTSAEDFNNPRWERTEYRGGLMFNHNDHAGVKTDYTYRRLGLDENNVEGTWSVSLFFNI
ncbi:MAG: hypothetical protein R2794_13695 [Chitinophagales bacterium]